MFYYHIIYFFLNLAYSCSKSCMYQFDSRQHNSILICVNVTNSIFVNSIFVNSIFVNSIFVNPIFVNPIFVILMQWRTHMKYTLVAGETLEGLTSPIVAPSWTMRKSQSTKVMPKNIKQSISYLQNKIFTIKIWDYDPQNKSTFL